ncbi:MAG: methanogenesis marker protein Mmp4/MtxX [Candidatus Methanomethylophilaceae archaeon]|jgi:putative methanogen marker protein 4
MVTSEEFLSGHLPDANIGIGRGSDNGTVEKSVEYFGRDNIAIYDNPEKLVSDLISGRIDAAVRGDMSSSVLLPIIKKTTGLKVLERVVLMEPPGGKLFLMAPVGIDEGWTVAQREALAVRAVALAERIGLGKKIAVMSGGRCEDYGRCKTVNKSIDDALLLVKKLKDKGYDAYHSQILIENAVREADILIAPEGISGNLLFRSMHLVGNTAALGAPIVNMDKVFVDTSRAKKDYCDSIALALRLTEK